jgi:hypothetical protein
MLLSSLTSEGVFAMALARTHTCTHSCAGNVFSCSWKVNAAIVIIVVLSFQLLNLTPILTPILTLILTIISFKN